MSLRLIREFQRLERSLVLVLVRFCPTAGVTVAKESHYSFVHVKPVVRLLEMVQGLS